MGKAEKRKEHVERMRHALHEMENQQPTDPTAATPQYQADVGRGTFARAEVTTSPKISRHDRVWETIRNAHPQLESTDVEALMEHCYRGQSVYEAAATNFESFEPEMLKRIMNMSEEDVEELLYGEDEEEARDGE